jgi:hypothetical protein
VYYFTIEEPLTIPTPTGVGAVTIFAVHEISPVRALNVVGTILRRYYPRTAIAEAVDPETVRMMVLNSHPNFVEIPFSSEPPAEAYTISEALLKVLQDDDFRIDES